MADANVMKIKARRFRFTWNNYTDLNVETLKGLGPKMVDYLVFGFEKAPTTGTPHLQGYVEFGNPITGLTAKGRLDPVLKKNSPICLLTCEASREDNVAYATKNETKDADAALKFGRPFLEVIHKRRNQGGEGQNKIWHEAYDALQDNPDFGDFAEKFPEIAIKHGAGVDKLIQSTKDRCNRQELLSKMDESVLKDWQLELVKELKNDPDDRKIIWYWDTTGGKGKTWISKYLVAKWNAARFENASSRDIAFAYNGERVCLFDFSRTVEGKVNYGVIESIKNGMIFSAKYASCSKVFQSPHIVIFANWPPYMGAMSFDRWDIRCLDEKDPNYDPFGEGIEC